MGALIDRLLMKRPKMWLTHDEEITEKCGDNGKHTFRLRIWRLKGQAPIVLVSQVDDGPPPNWATSRIATRVWRERLRFTKDGMGYFESYRRDGKQRLVSYLLEWVGHHDRAHVSHSMAACIQWGELLDLVGELVEP